MINCFSDNFSIICAKKGPGRIWDKGDIIEFVDGRIHRCYNIKYPKKDKFEQLYGYNYEDFDSLKHLLGLNDAQPPEFKDYGVIEQQRSAMCRLEYNNEV